MWQRYTKKRATLMKFLQKAQKKNADWVPPGDSNPGHLVGVPIHAQVANPNAGFENTAGISDSIASSWLYKQSMLLIDFLTQELESDTAVHALHGRCVSLLAQCDNFKRKVYQEAHEN